MHICMSYFVCYNNIIATCNHLITQVLRLSQHLLLQIASDDALIRLKRTALADQWEELTQIYYLQQHHSSITDFLQHHIQECSDLGSQDGLLMQVNSVPFRVLIDYEILHR